MQLLRLGQSARRRRVGIVLAFWLPWIFAACALAWRSQATLGWSLTVLVSVAAIVFATRSAKAIDAQFLSRQLDAQRRDLEDSADLLFARSDALPPLAQLQRERLERRLEAKPAPELRAHWPGRRIVINAFFATALTAVAFWWTPSTSHIPSLPRDAGQVELSLGQTQISQQQLEVRPPAYTTLPTRTEPTLQARVPEGSTLLWKFRFAPQPDSAELLFHDGTRLPLQRQGEDWTASRVLNKSTLYRLSLSSAVPTPVGKLLRIDVIVDTPPQVKVIEPERSLTLLEGKQTHWDLAFEASDDYGLGAAQLRITLAQGSGENISVSARTLSLPGTGDARHRSYRQRLDLGALGFAIGDDLVARLAVSDKRTPTAQTTRSASFILRWPPQLAAEASGIEGMVKRVLPAYFRSQRQIIIDSEELLKQRSKLSPEKFAKRSDEIGVDQRILRLRYGQFLGEESEGGRKPPVASNSTDGNGQAAPVDENHDATGDQMPAVTGDETSVLQDYAHTHDLPEAATLLDRETRALLKGALDEMWQAELHLRQGHPDQALPYENRALRFIKQVQQASRIYLARVGLELPPIDESRRLGGKRDGLTSRRSKLAAAQVEASPALPLWQALDDQRIGVYGPELEAFERWLRTNESSVPDALELFTAVDELRRAPECSECIDKLRAKLWRLLVAPPAAVSPRTEVDRAGRTYLENLQLEASPSASVEARP